MTATKENQEVNVATEVTEADATTVVQELKENEIQEVSGGKKSCGKKVQYKPGGGKSPYTWR